MAYSLGAVESFGQLDVRRFGVKGDGVFDDGPGFNLWLAAAMNAGARELVIPPPPGGMWNIATPLVLTGIANASSPNTFRLIGQRAASPMQVDLDATHDFLTVETQGEWWNVIIEGLCTVTSDLAQTTVDARYLYSLNNSGPARMTIRDCQNIGCTTQESLFNLRDGNFTIENFTDSAGVCSGKPMVHVNGSNLVYIDGFFVFWQGQWRGVSLMQGGCASVFGVTPMDSTDYNSNHQGTRFFAKNVWAGARNLTLVSVEGSATKIAKSVQIEDFFFNVGGGDAFYADHCEKMEIRRGTLANSANVKIDLGPGGVGTLRVVDLQQTPGIGGALQLDVDISNIGLVELENTDVNTVRQTSGFSPSPGPLIAKVYSTIDGVRSRWSNSGAAVAVNLLVKPDGAGSYIKLADADDGALATGVSVTAAGGANVNFRSVEERGQVVTMATDGTAIGEGAQVYASALAANGGKVSAVAVGKQVAVALAADAAGTVLALLV